jgi:hypothetical protein
MWIRWIRIRNTATNYAQLYERLPQILNSLPLRFLGSAPFLAAVPAFVGNLQVQFRNVELSPIVKFSFHLAVRSASFHLVLLLE